jgi:hypothetical protein
VRLQLTGRSAAVVGLALLALPAVARAQVVDVAPRSTVFVEPSKSSKLLVINPKADVSVRLGTIANLHAGYEADIVSGATESLKGGRLSPVDIVSSATNFKDTRHQFSVGGFDQYENGKFSIDYSRGVESDYRSHALSASASTNFFQKNTEIALAYGRGFDEVCTTGYTASDSPSVREALDSSKGCFKDGKTRATRRIDLDTFQVGWTQAWTPVFATQVVAYAGLQHGFLENPYRSVVIAPAGDQALENHPDNRFRMAAALRAKYYLRPLRVAFTAAGRLYRDTWDILGQTYELEAERFLLPDLRVMVRGRYYTQTEALFWSDDYTGGEPDDGPRGQYWTGDRELSPLSTYLLGGRFVFKKNADQQKHFAGFLVSFETSFSFDVMKTSLKEFTWGGSKPDDTLALIGSLGIRAAF